MEFMLWDKQEKSTLKVHACFWVVLSQLLELRPGVCIVGRSCCIRC